MSKLFSDNAMVAFYGRVSHDRTVKDVETLARSLVGDATLRLTFDSPETLAAIERFCAENGYTLTLESDWENEGAIWSYGYRLCAIRRA